MRPAEAKRVAQSRRPLVDAPPDGYRWGVPSDAGKPLIVKVPRERPVPKRCGNCGSRHAELREQRAGKFQAGRVTGYRCHYERECEQRRIRAAIAGVLQQVDEALARCRGARAREVLRSYRNGLRVGLTAAGGRVARS